MARGRKKSKRQQPRRGGQGGSPQTRAPEVRAEDKVVGLGPGRSGPTNVGRSPSTATEAGSKSKPSMPTRRVFGFIRIGTIDFIGHRKFFAVLSGILILVSLFSLGARMVTEGRPLNYGIDFLGGNSYTFDFSRPVTDQELRTALASVGISGATIRVDREDPSEVVIKTPAYLDETAEVAMSEALESAFGEYEATLGDAVSPAIGRELVRDALIATALACLGILLYVAFRFEHRFAVAGVVALVHDTIVTVGVFSIFGLEVNAPFVAAILTVIGFSINDTIVVFDRVRDNLRKRTNESLVDLSNQSINETFVRSVNTSVTAFLAIAAVFFFGGVTTRDFALALMVGIAAGTYSTICIATPVWLWWRTRDERAQRASKSRMIDARKKVRV